MRDFYTKENMQGQAFHVPDAGLYFEPAELVFETETDTGREGVIRVLSAACGVCGNSLLRQPTEQDIYAGSLMPAALPPEGSSRALFV